MRCSAALSALTSDANAGCSRGSPPVTTTLSTSRDAICASKASSVVSCPPVAAHEYFVSHHTHPTEQPWSRTKTDGVPTLTPSPCTEAKTSLTRSEGEDTLIPCQGTIAATRRLSPCETRYSFRTRMPYGGKPMVRQWMARSFTVA